MAAAAAPAGSQPHTVLSGSDEMTVVVRTPAPPNQPPVANAGPDQTVGLVPTARRAWIVVNNDEWTLTDFGLSLAPTGAQFARNVASLFAGGRPGNFLVYSTNFGLTGTTLRNAMEAAGHTWTVSVSTPFTVPNLLQYDAVFLSGNTAPQEVLIEYVHAGGSVYVAGGTGLVRPAAEAIQWNTFLNAFGLRYEPSYNGVQGVILVSSTDPLLAGVKGLYYNNGNNVAILTPADPRLRMLHQSGTNGLLAVFEGTPGDTGHAVVTLKGTVTDDGLPEGSTLTASWTQVSGPSPAVFADPSAASTTATLDRAGVYVLQLTASDGELADEDDVVVTVGILEPGESVEVRPRFTDVPRTSGYYRFVETLLHRGVTSGCLATNYCPALAVTREQMAVFVLVAKEGAGYVAPPCGATPMFTDVPVGDPFCPWIEELARRHVVAGCGGGDYCPRSPVSREEMAVFVLGALEGPSSPPACAPPNVFADVPQTNPFCPWIEELARRNVVAGCGGGNYCPVLPVTREQMAVFISATFGLVLYGQ